MAIQEPFDVFLGAEFGVDCQLDREGAPVVRGILDRDSTIDADGQVMFLNWSVLVRTEQWRVPKNPNDPNDYGLRDIVERGSVITANGIRWKCESGLEPEPPDGVFSRIQLATYPCP